MLKWKEKSSGYSDKKVVTGAESRAGEFKLSIHRHIYHEPDAWLASADGLFSAKKMKSKDLSEAKSQATAILQGIFEEALLDITDP